MKRELTLVLALAAPAALAEEAIVTLQSTVTGNQEQPRVMYILPWRTPERTVVSIKPGSDIAGELFEEVEREPFQRELRYRELLADVPHQGMPGNH